MTLLIMFVLFTVCTAQRELVTRCTNAKILHLHQVDTIECTFDGHHPSIMVHHQNELLSSAIIRSSNTGSPTTVATLTIDMTFDTAGRYKFTTKTLYALIYRAVLGPLTCGYTPTTMVCNFTASFDPNHGYILNWLQDSNVKNIITNQTNKTVDFVTIFSKHYNNVDVVITYKDAQGYLHWGNDNIKPKLPTFTSTGNVIKQRVLLLHICLAYYIWKIQFS